MYQTDGFDQVVRIEGLPRRDPGAPLPLVLADEHRVILAYGMPIAHAAFDGSNPRSVSSATTDITYALVEFDACIHTFGYPNEEALSGHPLYDRGLGRPGCAFEVLHSSWIRTLRQMNLVRFPQHPAVFDDDRHLILAFHDSIFECVASGFKVHEARACDRRSIVAHMNALMHDAAR